MNHRQRRGVSILILNQLILVPCDLSSGGRWLHVDKNAKFNLIAIRSPFFGLRPISAGRLICSVASGLFIRSTMIWMFTQARCLHEAVFDAMIAELDKNGIDTSELKVQKMQTMNINILAGIGQCGP